MYGVIGKDVAVSSDTPSGYNGASYQQAIYGLRPVNAQGVGFGEDSTAWWAGSSFEVSMFSPLSVKLDAMYGSVDGDDIGGVDMDRAGYWLSALSTTRWT